MKKLLIIVPSLNSGGAERQCAILIKHIDPTIYDVHLCVWQPVFEYKIPSHIPVHVIPRRRPVDILKAIYKLAILIKNLNPDLIYSQIHFTNLITGTAIRLARSKARFVCRLTISPKFVVPTLQLSWARFVYRRANAIVTCSRGVANEAETHIGISASKLFAIDNLAEIDFIIKQANIKYVQRDTQFTIVHVGRLVPQKNQLMLLHAISKVCHPAIRLWMIGEGPMLKELMDAAIQLKIDDRIDWWGRQPNPFPYIRSADCLILSSDFEGLPNVIIEAMICKTPVIATDCPYGPSELIEHAKTGWLVPVRDAAALARQIEKVAADPDGLSIVAQNAHNEALKRFNAQSQALKLEQLLSGGPGCDPQTGTPQGERQ